MTVAAPPGFDRDYVEVQQFYAHHMQLLDSGAAEEWTGTFTEDCVVTLPTLPEPIRGRAGLAKAVARAAADRSARGEVQRHWHGMVAVYPNEDGTARVRCYALVFLTSVGGVPRLHRTCVCEDVLVRDANGWLVRERFVTRDDLPGGNR